jgi:hypothetical protein
MAKKLKFIFFIIGIAVFAFFSALSAFGVFGFSFDIWWIKLCIAVGALLTVIGLNGLYEKYTVFDETAYTLKKFVSALNKTKIPGDSLKTSVTLISARGLLSNAINNAAELCSKYDIYRLNYHIAKLKDIQSRMTPDRIADYTDKNKENDIKTVKDMRDYLVSIKKNYK